jgi:serine/threonine-protein kinase HipA
MVTESVEVLHLTLHGASVGYLAGYQNGRNILVFDPDYQHDANRPTLTLTGLSEHPASARLYSTPWSRQQRLHPVMSNLLPEGSLREWMAQELKIHPDNEFPLFSELANELPGALRAAPVAPADIPDWVLERRSSIEAILRARDPGQVHFSLAGVQMKFSMFTVYSHFRLSQTDQLGTWIIKTPSTRHQDVPRNEYTMMKLAALAGVDIPEIALVPMDRLQGLPAINLPNESEAFAIKRFDRDDDQRRVHTEDFAQVLFKYAHDKYGGANFENIGRIIYEYTGHGLANLQEMARRLLVNILLANGDAHLKNWSLIYADKITPELAPAYDIVFTKAYIKNEKAISLNLAGTKNYTDFSLTHFEAWAKKSGAPWKAIKPHLDDVLEKARAQWPAFLQEAPLSEQHKAALRNHWGQLHEDFRLH